MSELAKENSDGLQNAVALLAEALERSANVLDRHLDGQLTSTSRTNRLSAGAVTVIAALLGLATGTIGSYLQWRSPLQVERAKFESTLILEALKSETQEEAAKRLHFLVRARLIDGRDGAIERLVSEPLNLPIRTREMRLRDAQSEIGCPEGMIFDGGALRCVQELEHDGR